MNLTDNYRIFYTVAVEYTLLLAAHIIIPQMDNILNHKTNLTKMKISDHMELKSISREMIETVQTYGD